MDKLKSPFTQFVMSPLAVILPVAIFTLLALLSFININEIQTDAFEVDSALLFHCLILLLFCTAYVVFLIKIRATFSQLQQLTISNQLLADEKTKVLKEEIRQHKAARNELQRLATHDQLTGARNRRHFRDTLSSELERYKRYRSDFSLLILDLDNFQSINDRYGHEFGDVVLQKFAHAIQQDLRQSDVFVRYGGQEFAIIATNTEVDSALRFAQKLCQNIELLEILADGIQVNLTVSIGVGSPSLLEELTTQQLVSSTENALRDAKANGKNQAMGIKASQLNH